MGFEPTTPVSQGKRLAGARTRPLCDPSSIYLNIATKDDLNLLPALFLQLKFTLIFSGVFFDIIEEFFAERRLAIMNLAREFLAT